MMISFTARAVVRASRAMKGGFIYRDNSIFCYTGNERPALVYQNWKNR